MPYLFCSKRRKAFTLVELLVVIAILAVLATVSVVSYTRFIERANKAAAFADAQAIATSLLPENATEKKDLVMFIEKSGKVYIYGYDGSDYEVVTYKELAYKIEDGKGFEATVEEIVSSMQSGSDIIADTTASGTWREHERIAESIEENGFDCAVVAVYADFNITESFTSPSAPTTPPSPTPEPEPEPEPEPAYSWDEANKILLFDGVGYTGILTDAPDVLQAIPNTRYENGIPVIECVKSGLKYKVSITEAFAPYSSVKLDFGRAAQALIDNNTTSDNIFKEFIIEITDETGGFNVSKASISSSVLKSYFETGMLEEKYVPFITQSRKFSAFIGSSAYSTAADYANSYTAGKSDFTAYLKEKYGVTSFDNIPFNKLNSHEGDNADGYFKNTENPGLAYGNNSNIRHVEPEVINLLMKNLYASGVHLVFAEYGDTSFETLAATYNSALYTNYDFAGKNWGKSISSDCDAYKLYSMYDLSVEEAAADVNLKKSGDTYSGKVYIMQHYYTKGTATSGITYCPIDTFTITMTK